MTPERWRQIEQLYHAALGVESARRAAFLEEACAGDEALRREVGSLLVSRRPVKDFVGAPAQRANWPAGDQAGAEKYSLKYCPKCGKSYPLTQRYCLEDGALLSLQDPYHLVGRTLADKYRIDALVGVGGMGAVYSAYHLGIDRQVAFKILLPHLALSSERTISLFEREAKMAGRLSHENIVNIFDAGRTPDEIAYIAM